MKWLKNGFAVLIKYFCCYCFRKIILCVFKVYVVKVSKPVLQDSKSRYHLRKI